MEEMEKNAACYRLRPHPVSLYGANRIFTNINRFCYQLQPFPSDTDKKTPPKGRGYVTVMKERFFSRCISKEQGLTVNLLGQDVGFRSSYDALELKTVARKNKKEKVDWVGEFRFGFSQVSEITFWTVWTLDE